MSKPGISIDIPGFGRRHITTVLTDYTGTLSCGGRMATDAKDAFCRLAQLLEIHVLTADTFGYAGEELKGVPVNLVRMMSEHHSVEKQEYGEKIGLGHCAVFGNGNNDRLLLKAAKESGGIAIAVDNGEGCATEALLNSQIFIVGALNALNLLLEPKGCKATLRR
jgi:soluble P-type ATPase